MPEATDLNSTRADCWKLVWKVDPAPLRVPLPATADDEPDAAGADPEAATDELDELDDEHAARASAAITAPPAATACLLPRSCM